MAQEDDNPRSRRGTSEGMSVDTLPQKVQLECSKFLARLRRHQVPHALDIARKTLEIMRLVVATSGAKDLGGLIALIKQAGQILVSAQPHELVIGNMVRRVLYIVREETREQAMAPEGGAAQSSSATSSGRSLHRILEAPPDAPDYSELPAKNLKAPILEVLNEVIEELSSVSAAIAEQAIEHIHSNEVILTHGRDPAVEAFLKAAHKKRTFEVIVCETSPANEGQQTAAALAEAGISTTLISDAAVFAMMARVNKVIVGCHAVMANGGLIAAAGSHMVALAAQQHAVPLVVCAGLYKLTPTFPSGAEQFNVLRSPMPMLRYEEGLQGVHVPNPARDYVPPELVSLFITNIGGNHASYIYRLLSEYYHQEDYHIFNAE